MIVLAIKIALLQIWKFLITFQLLFGPSCNTETPNTGNTFLLITSGCFGLLPVAFVLSASLPEHVLIIRNSRSLLQIGSVYTLCVPIKSLTDYKMFLMTYKSSTWFSSGVSS